MRKNLRVIQINGFRGIIMALAVLTCLIAGFVVFPGYLLMTAWNSLLVKFVSVPLLGLVQGSLLWGIVVVSYMIIKKRHVMICFKNPTELSEDEINEVMDKMKYEAATKMMSEIITNAKSLDKPNLIDHNNTSDIVDEQVESVNKNIDN